MKEESPFKCPYCGEQEYRNSHPLTHVQVNHPKEWKEEFKSGVMTKEEIEKVDDYLIKKYNIKLSLKNRFIRRIRKIFNWISSMKIIKKLFCFFKNHEFKVTPSKTLCERCGEKFEFSPMHLKPTIYIDSNDPYGTGVPPKNGTKLKNKFIANKANLKWHRKYFNLLLQKIGYL